MLGGRCAFLPSLNQQARTRTPRLAYPRLICSMLRWTLCTGWIYVLESGESAIMFHIPPVVCVSWGLGSWCDVSHTDLPAHNRGEDVLTRSPEDIKVTFLHTAEMRIICSRRGTRSCRVTGEYHRWNHAHVSIGLCVQAGRKLWQEMVSSGNR